MRDLLRDFIVTIGNNPLGHNHFMPMCFIEEIDLT